MAYRLFGLLPIVPLRTHFSDIGIEIQSFSFTKIHLGTSSEEWWPFCSGGDALKYHRSYHQLKQIICMVI